MAKVTISINGNELDYDAQECTAKDFAAIINASIYHLKLEFQEKGIDIGKEINTIEKSLNTIKA